MLSPAIQQQLEEARQDLANYKPNSEIVRRINDKALIMLIGPVAVGKTYIITQTARRDPDFASASTLTTRGSRPDDHPGMFRYIPHDDQHISNILQKIEKRELVSYAIHPTTDHIYVTEPRDFPFHYNMLATLSKVAESFATLPFKQTYAVGIAADPSAWHARLATRYPEPNKERQKRLQEAIVSLEWLLSHEVIWIDNSNKNDDVAATQLIKSIKYGALPPQEIAVAHAKEMLKLAKEML